MASSKENTTQNDKTSRNNYRKVMRFFRFINKNIGVITWFSTISVAIIATVLRFLNYTFQKGFVDFWEIEATDIVSTNSNSIYDVVFVVILSLLMFFIVFVLANLKNFTRSKLIKILLSIPLYSLFSLIFLIYTDLWIMIEQTRHFGIIACLIASAIILALLVYVFRFSISIFSLSENEADNNKKTGYLVIVLLFVTICMIVGLYFVGRNTAENQTFFRVTNDNYAIIYETETKYYLAEFDDIENCINKNHQKIIDKDELEFKWCFIERKTMIF